MCYGATIDQNLIRNFSALEVRHLRINSTPGISAGEAFRQQALELNLHWGVNHQQKIELNPWPSFALDSGRRNFPFGQKGGVYDDCLALLSAGFLDFFF